MESKRYARFSTRDDSTVRYGIIEGDVVTPLAEAPWESFRSSGKTVPLDDVKLHAPASPSKILCIGLNYSVHVEASLSADKVPDQPLVFLKPPSAIIGPGDPIVHPSQSDRVDYEAELAVVIGQRARDVAELEYERVIFGYTCANDVTARDLQKKDGQWGRAKGFDSFCPVGPWIVPTLAENNVKVEGIHNGEVRQSGYISDMIFPIPRLICYLSSIFTLMPGDIILTGTPSGIAPMKPGDEIEVRISGIGSLNNYVTR